MGPAQKCKRSLSVASVLGKRRLGNRKKLFRLKCILHPLTLGSLQTWFFDFQNLQFQLLQQCQYVLFRYGVTYSSLIYLKATSIYFLIFNFYFYFIFFYPKQCRLWMGK